MTRGDGGQVATPPLRVGVVGPGSWGRQHLRVFSRRPDTSLVAVVGQDRDRTELVAADYESAPYTDIGEMLEKSKPDLVTVALPNERHFDATLQLVRAGVPLFVEKPLVFTLAEADQLLKEAAERNLFFAINFNHRYAEPVLRAKAAIDRGELGRIAFASWRFGGEPSSGHHPYGQLIETQCHGFDTLEHLAGPIASVMAQMTDNGHGAHTTAVVAIEFASGAVGSLVGTYDSSYAYPLSHYLEINGSLGRALIEDTVRRLTVSRTGQEVRQVWESGYFNDDGRDFMHTLDRHVDDLLAALRVGQDPPVHARAGRRALELAYACISSFETGQRVTTTHGARTGG